MNQTTINYLDSYIEQLDRVSTQADVYGQLSDWHFATKNELAAAVEDINSTLGLVDEYRLRPHMATTAIGRLSEGIVVVSANPGFSDRSLAQAPGKLSPNGYEDAYRSQSADTNRAFCRDFFAEYPRACHTYSPYWRMVMRFYEHYAGEAPAQATPLLWERMAAQPAIGGIDLLPFHSTKDRITPFLMGRSPDPHLRRVAIATLEMAIRLSPKMLLVTSHPGQNLIRDLLAGGDQGAAVFDAVPLPQDPAWPAPYNRIAAWDVASQGGATKIVSIPYQIFSGSFRAAKAGYSAQEFAEKIRAFLA
jgi:hypothetical protein